MMTDPGLRSALRRWWRGLWAPAVGKAYARGYHRSMLFIFTAVSVLLNSSHSALEGKGAVEIVMAAGVAAVPPLALLAATHSVIAFIRHTTKRIRWVTRVQLGLAVLMAGIGGVAFRASFVALSDMGERMHMRPGDGWMLPTIVDSMIVISTIALVVVEKERALDAAEAEAAPAAVQPVQDTPADTPTPVSWTPRVTPGQRVDDTPDGQRHAPAATSVTDSVDTVSQAADLDVDSVTAVLGTAASTVQDADDTAVTDTLDDSPRDALTAAVDTVIEGVQDTPDTAVTDTVDAVSMTPVTGVSTDLRDIASEVVDVVGTSADVEVVERALELALDGLSARKISEALAPDGPSRTPVAAWVKAAKEQPGYQALAATGRPRPQLVAVND